MMILDDKKYSFGVDEKQLNLFGKNKKPEAGISIEHLTEIDTFEFTALLFAFGKLHHQQLKSKVLV